LKGEIKVVKKFCDRCGKEIKKTDAYYELNTERKMTSYLTVVPTGDEIVCAHLCIDCEKKLKNFLEKYE
jgi:hypothetical protein